MSRFDINWLMPLLAKCRMTCLHVAPRVLKKKNESLLTTLFDGQHIRQSYFLFHFFI